MIKLQQCHLDIQKIFLEVIKRFDCTITCGHRGQVEQDAAYAAGNSKLQYPNSKHNTMPSMAVDAYPFPIKMSDTNRMRYFAGFVLGTATQLLANGEISHNVRWGGDWDKDTEVSDNTFNDLVHFELY